MHDGPRYGPFESSEFFTDGSSARMPVASTVSRNPLADDDELLYTGKINGTARQSVPDAGQRGAHGSRAGAVQRVLLAVPRPHRQRRRHGRPARHASAAVVHEDRLRDAPAGYFFDVMTHGFGAMQDYAAQISVTDRWAIAAYVRALQFSQHATVGDVPDDRRADLDRPATAPAGEAPRPEAP